jgi:hypothetical protein
MGIAVTDRRDQARPGRRVVVAADLADLRGPVSGEHVLPLRLYWSPPGRVWRLDEAESLRLMYRYVLGEAIRAEELAEHLNGDQLVAVWPDLILPRAVRRAWEERHPQLAAASAVAA